jgi:phosphoenolpyruvate synthase/pyruvate phosphate dikinase
MSTQSDPIVWLESVGQQDVARVGGKNASLGEMIAHLAREGIRVPPGFATTAAAYRQFLAANRLTEVISAALNELATGKASLPETGESIRRAFLRAQWPQETLERGAQGVEVYVMCEILSNVILAREFARRFDGFSIGSNDLTQLTLGVDRDSAELAGLFDEQNDAVKWMIRHVISAAGEARAKVGLCGQAPSDHPAFAEFLVDCGIDSISVSPDSFVAVKRVVAAAEDRLGRH